MGEWLAAERVVLERAILWAMASICSSEKGALATAVETGAAAVVLGATVEAGRKPVPSHGPVRLARDVLADWVPEHDPARGDVEFADFGLVGAGA